MVFLSGCRCRFPPVVGLSTFPSLRLEGLWPIAGGVPSGAGGIAEGVVVAGLRVVGLLWRLGGRLGLGTFRGKNRLGPGTGFDGLLFPNLGIGGVCFG